MEITKREIRCVMKKSEEKVGRKLGRGSVELNDLK